jgi:hypothetical protein
MKALILIGGLFLVAPTATYSAQDSNGKLTTNLVEILSYIQAFGRTLDLDLPEPLTTNHVTRFRPYKFIGKSLDQLCSIEVQGRWQFGFDVKYRFINSFTDRKHAMIVLWKPEDILPLLKPSKLTQEQALALAREYLRRLGYSEENSPVLPPEVKPWKWEPAGTNRSDPLPFYTIQWRWKLRPEGDYYTMEIDGLRERVNYFSTAYRSFAERSFEEHGVTNLPAANHSQLEKIETSSASERNVVFISLPSNRVLSGVVEIPVELHATNNDHIVGINFLLDGEPSDSIRNPRPQPPQPPIRGYWDTRVVSNGWHTLQALAEYPDATKRYTGGYNQYSSAAVRVQTFNPVILDIPLTYGTLDTGVPFAFPIKALVATSNAAWKITISTESNQVLQVLTGTTTNGVIDAVWDGTPFRPMAVQIEVETISTNDWPRVIEHWTATREGL